jgi:hypothetical protein
MKKILYIALVALFAACTPPAVEEDKLFLTEDEAQDLISQGTILSLQEFKDTFMTERGNYFSDTTFYRSRAYVVKGGDTTFLFSIDTIAKREKPIYIRGRVTTDDQGGNFYKTLCIQQMEEGKQQALRISVDAGSASGLYPRGQEILIRVDGLAIGRYSNQPQLCLPSYNNNVYAYYANEKIGWAPGRIPAAIFKEHTQCIGLPDVKELVYEELEVKTFNDILDIKKAREMDGWLVRLKNMRYTGEYEKGNKCEPGDPETNSNANVFAPTTNNLNYPQSRIIASSIDQTTNVSTSEYAKFAHFYLPGADQNGVANCGDYVGDVEGILGFYLDKPKTVTEDMWAISICDLDDLKLYKDLDGDKVLDDNERVASNLWPRLEYQKTK